jgi:hypothetical protein
MMTKRFKTAIELCGEIDADYGAGGIPEEDDDNRSGIFGGY